MRGGELATAPARVAPTSTLALILAVAGLVLAAPALGAPPEPPPEPFGHPCTEQAVTEGGDVLFCPTEELDDRVPSFDEDPGPGETRAPLDVDVTLPGGYESGDGPLPTIVMLHGYGGSKEDFETDSPDGDSSEDDILYHYNNVWFAQRGYAVLNYTARGFGRSCGSEDSASTPDCRSSKSYVHLADQRWEARDTQYLVGLLVDQGITAPEAIGVTGISYGGGQSIELAMLRDRIRDFADNSFKPWKSPAGTPLEISAAYPRWPWSDLVSSLLPNGRFLDFRIPPPESTSRNPLGIMKESYVDGLYALGLQSGTYCGEPPRPDAPICNDFTADLTRYYLRVQAGEPYGAEVRRIANQIFRFHQGFGLEGRRPAPLLIENGWTDDLFPPKEAIRLYNDIRAEYPKAPVSILLGDLGHARASNKENSDRFFNDSASTFFDRRLGGGSGTATVAAPESAPRALRRGAVTAFTQTCPEPKPANGPFHAPRYSLLGEGTLGFSRKGSRTVLSGGGNPATGVAIDPIGGGFAGPLFQGDGACTSVPREQAPGTAVVRAPVSRGFTLLGLPTVKARVSATGNFAQLDSRLWDVAPNGEQMLVSRGAYRLRNGQDGRVTLQLHGNGYCFQSGHVPKLELLGQDAPYLRPSNGGAFSVAVSDVEVELPTAEADPVPDLELTVTPEETRVGRATSFRFTVTSRDDRCATAENEQPDPSVPVEGARVSFAGHAGRTDEDGRLTMSGRFSESGATTARATRAGYDPGSAGIRVLPAAEAETDGVDDGGGSGGGDSTGGTGTGASGRTDASSAAGATTAFGGGGGDRLPFTGLGLALLALAGAVLAGTGMALRRRAGARAG